MIDAIPFPDAAVLAAFIAASFALYLTPGADMMFTIGCAASGGPRAALAAAAGIGLGVLVHVGVAAAGLAALLLAWPGALDAIRYAGAAYLVWLAVRMWRAEPEPAPARGARALRRAFARGFVTNILNPKTALFVLAFLPQFTSAEAGPSGRRSSSSAPFWPLAARSRTAPSAWRRARSPAGCAARRARSTASLR